MYSCMITTVEILCIGGEGSKVYCLGTLKAFIIQLVSLFVTEIALCTVHFFCYPESYRFGDRKRQMKFRHNFPACPLGRSLDFQYGRHNMQIAIPGCRRRLRLLWPSSWNDYRTGCNTFLVTVFIRSWNSCGVQGNEFVLGRVLLLKHDLFFEFSR